MLDALTYPFDGSQIVAQKRKIKKQLLDGDKTFVKKHVAILGGSTTAEIKNILELFLLKDGIQPVFYESEYNRFYEDSLFDNPELKEFKPDIIYVYTTNRNLKNVPDVNMSAEEVKALLNEDYQCFERVWTTLRDKYNCEIIQNNFERPLYRLLGNRDCYDIHAQTFYIYRLNGLLYEFAQNNDWLHVCDLDYVASDYGLCKWQNPRNWYMYKYALPIDAIPYLAYNVANIIKAMCGRNKKGLVLDCDNTLWGGVIGDDGVEGIEIGEENAEAEAYAEFQRYLKSLKTLGVILNIDSKNDLSNALKGLEHRDSVLAKNDFVEIRANWENKDRNLADIAKSLNLLPESLVFVDDNPAEREIVTSQFSDVVAPKIDAVENYIQILDRQGVFETVNLSDDDRHRAEMYQKNKERLLLQQNFVDYDEYLRSLEMRAEIVPFEQMSYGRIAQLINKSNQFNLTTRRYSQEQVEEMALSPDYVTLQGRLIDKFGDNGIVSMVIGHVVENVCQVDLWVMSCRVLKRDLEFAMMDALVRECQKRSLKKILGMYIPTAKNALVKNHYETLGFAKVKEHDDGATEWEFSLNANYVNKNTVIKVN